MDPITMVSLGMAVTGCAIGISAWIKQGKTDTADLEGRLTSLEIKVDSFQQAIKVTDIAKMGQQLVNLNKRVEKLDTDVEKKIDQLTEKVDNLMVKMNELLVEIAKR